MALMAGYAIDSRQARLGLHSTSSAYKRSPRPRRIFPPPQFELPSLLSPSCHLFSISCELRHRAPFFATRVPFLAFLTSLSCAGTQGTPYTSPRRRTTATVPPASSSDDPPLPLLDADHFPDHAAPTRPLGECGTLPSLSPTLRGKLSRSRAPARNSGKQLIAPSRSKSLDAVDTPSPARSHPMSHQRVRLVRPVPLRLGP